MLLNLHAQSVLLPCDKHVVLLNLHAQSVRRSHDAVSYAGWVARDFRRSGNSKSAVVQAVVVVIVVIIIIIITIIIILSF